LKYRAPIAAINLNFAGTGGGQGAGFLLLVAFLASFGFIRMSARLMRSPKVPWWPGSVQTGGLHIHHLVFGIVAMLLAGFLGFALQPDSPWFEILAIVFGIGAGLTLDEYALWLHLEDVYWAEEGRRSVDAVIVATVLAGLILLGFVPFGDRWTLDLSGVGGPVLDTGQSTSAVLVAIAINLSACAVAAFKGKLYSALAGIFIPPIAWVTAIRLAMPGSPWARRRYRPDGPKIARATLRQERHQRRLRRWQDRIGGKPSTPEPGAIE
jgi:lysyl-tRNA synthetase class 2